MGKRRLYGIRYRNYSTYNNPRNDFKFTSVCSKNYIELLYSKLDTVFIFIDPYRLHINQLEPPRDEFLVRALDPAFVINLKTEVLERSSTFVKPFIAVVRDLHNQKDLDEASINKYSIEIIGGNHRREAFMQLQKENKLEEKRMIMQVQLYTGL